MNEQQHKKLLIIGDMNFVSNEADMRIEGASWHDLARVSNIADFDVVLLNLMYLQDRRHREEVDWDRLASLLSFQTVVDVLEPGGHIILLGDPRFEITLTDSSGPVTTTRSRPFLHWTGAFFDWQEESGTTLESKTTWAADHFRSILTHVLPWRYSLIGLTLNPTVARLKPATSQWDQTDTPYNADFLNLFATRSGRCLIADLYYRVGRDPLYSSPSWPGGSITLIPPLLVRPEEASALVLSDLYGISLLKAEPTWAREITAPREEPVRTAITEAEEQVRAFSVTLGHLRDEQSAYRTTLLLLYGSDKQLEGAVLAALQALGANVAPPTEPGYEDGWIEVDLDGGTHKGVLEIKSTRSAMFDEKGRRQAADWVLRGADLYAEQFKGIFFGCSSTDLHPAERKWPFSDSWSKRAAAAGISAVRTEDLFTALLLDHNGSLDRERFWRAILDTSGVAVPSALFTDFSNLPQWSQVMPPAT